MQIARNQLTAGAALIASVIVAGPTFADSSPTQAQVPSDGGQVKSGDVILWQVSKTIKLQKPVSEVSAKEAAAGAAITAADSVAAAAAIEAAARRAIGIAIAPADNATPEEKASYQALTAAVDQAAAAVAHAKSAAYDAGAGGKPASSAGTMGALKSDFDAATSNKNTAASAVATSRKQAQVDQRDADQAAQLAGKGSASQKTDATARSKKAQESANLYQAASQKLDVATAYLSAVNAAVIAAATAAPASASSPGVTTEDDRVCFPRNSLFQVTNVVAAAKPADGVAPNDTVTSNTQLVSGNFSFRSGFWTFHWLHLNSLPTNAGRDPCGDGSPVAVKAKTYDFTADQLTKQDFNRGGLTWGALVIPYKYYFTDKSFKSNASTVAFLGYEGWFPGVSLSGVVAAGAGLASSTQSTSTPPADSTTPASTNSFSFVTYTMAVGVVAAFGDSKTVKAGLLFGRDYQGKDSGFKYENKTWMALSIGAGF